ncbi:MAG TPA: AraC family transcriptional regulator [Roseiarcus sp.]|jgi:AraC-like DNA-binding protein
MMRADLAAGIAVGLERSCEPAGRERIVAAPASAGLERIEARFFGPAFARHRHDTYAIGVTLAGVQTFWYRGAQRRSLPGQTLVLHPDEIHDGGAGDEAGLRYRMLYVEPALLCAALGEGAPPPFVAEPVFDDPALYGVLSEALGPLDTPLDELETDDIVGRLARALARRAGRPARSLAKPAARRAELARDYLEANAGRAVSSAELEHATGLDRYALARHFRALYATSPHRYLVMRRLQRARTMIGAGDPLADVAAATGFADQSHLNRHFKKAFGMPPGRWAALTGR